MGTDQETRRDTTGLLLGGGLLGVGTLLSGLVVDAYLHGRDPSLASREGVFTLTNPGHVLLLVGIALVVGALVTLGYQHFVPRWGRWALRGALGTAGTLLVLAAGAIHLSVTTEHGGGHHDVPGGTSVAGVSTSRPGAESERIRQELSDRTPGHTSGHPGTTELESAHPHAEGAAPHQD